MDLDEAVGEARRILEKLATLPEREREAEYEKEIAALPANARAFIATAIATRELVIRPPENNLLITMNFLERNWDKFNFEKIAAFFFGVAFIVVILALVLFVPHPTDTQFFVFRVVLSLAGGCVAGLIPGFLNIDSKIRKNFTLRAGGAVAVTVLIYLINPPALVTGS